VAQRSHGLIGGDRGDLGGGGLTLPFGGGLDFLVGGGGFLSLEGGGGLFADCDTGGVFLGGGALVETLVAAGECGGGLFAMVTALGGGGRLMSAPPQYAARFTPLVLCSEKRPIRVLVKPAVAGWAAGLGE
jgi:hypothetical protein